MVTAIMMMKRLSVNNQIEPAFNRGKIKSDDPNMMEIKIFPNPPINTGMMKKNIMNRPWNEIADVYCWDDTTM
jgi:hypothetical protein